MRESQKFCYFSVCCIQALLFLLVFSVAVYAAAGDTETLAAQAQMKEGDAEKQLEAEVVKLSAAEIEQLVAPVALYPDDLLAQVLTASTVPLDVVKAARYQEQNKGATKPSEEVMKSWEPAVVSLMMFPDTLKMMYDNLEWTEQLGAAIYAQEDDVYNSIQLLRRQAEGVGNLESNDKQVIVIEKEIIKIVPAAPEIIYVPVYDPLVIFLPPPPVLVPHPAPLITFGVGVTVGIGLSYAFDWQHRHVVHHYHWGLPGHHRHHYYRRHPPVYPGRPPGAWRPPPPSGVRPPGYRPPRPHPPGARPPGYRPPPSGGRPPGYRPGNPSRPPRPEVRPPGNRPGNPSRPPQAGGRPSGNRPSQLPSSQVRNYDRGSQARKASNRGRSSRGGGRPQSSRPANRGGGGGGGRRR